MKTISIIIPVLNESAALTANLPLLQSWRQRGHELVVVDGGSSDRSLSMCVGLVDHVLSAPAGRASQMNAGAKVASGDVLLFLHIDSVLPTILPQELLDALIIANRQWGRFDVRLSGSGAAFRIIESMMNLRSRITGIATGDQAIFVRREVFERVGGYAAIALMEDVQLCRALLQSAGRPLCLRQRVQSSSRRWQQHGVLKTVLLMWQLRLAWFLGADAADLHARYYGAQATDVGVLFFARSPVAGKVKTRFIPSLGQDGALALHKQLIALTWQRITAASGSSAAGCFAMELWLSEAGEEDWFAGVCKTDAVYLQQGQDLGQCMAHALNDALTRAPLVLVVGSDCASLDVDYLQQAVQALRTGADLVIGPAEDGGYVLLGVRAQVPDGIFNNIDWGTDQVFAQTRLRLSASGIKWQSLAPRWDVDRPEDLQRLQALL